MLAAGGMVEGHLTSPIARGGSPAIPESPSVSVDLETKEAWEAFVRILRRARGGPPELEPTMKGKPAGQQRRQKQLKNVPSSKEADERAWVGPAEKRLMESFSWWVRHVQHRDHRPTR